MSQTYKATGINLKSIPLGEADRILTILTREYGLIRAVAPGSRKPKSKLGGRGELFVVNDLLLSKGRSLDRLTQAETLESYPRLGRDLAKLTVSQYWAEVVLDQTPSHDPNPVLFDVVCDRLHHLVICEPGIPILIHLVYGLMQFLNIAGIVPQVHRCCATDQPVISEEVGNGRVIFSPAAGGVILPTSQGLDRARSYDFYAQARSSDSPKVKTFQPGKNRAPVTLSASELALMQRLAQASNIMTPHSSSSLENLLLCVDAAPSWFRIEQALRGYIQYHTERPIRSAALLESCFTLTSPAVSAVHP